MPKHVAESSQQKIENSKNNALIAYILMGLGIFTGVFWIIGAIWAMVKKDDAVNTPFHDHYSNIIKTFWWGLAWTILGMLLWVFVIGAFIMLFVWIWSIYRIVKGIARLTSNQSYKD